MNTAVQRLAALVNINITQAATDTFNTLIHTDDWPSATARACNLLKVRDEHSCHFVLHTPSRHHAIILPSHHHTITPSHHRHTSWWCTVTVHASSSSRPSPLTHMRDPRRQWLGETTFNWVAVHNVLEVGKFVNTVTGRVPSADIEEALALLLAFKRPYTATLLPPRGVGGEVVGEDETVEASGRVDLAVVHATIAALVEAVGPFPAAVDWYGRVTRT